MSFYFLPPHSKKEPFAYEDVSVNSLELVNTLYYYYNHIKRNFIKSLWIEISFLRENIMPFSALFLIIYLIIE